MLANAVCVERRGRGGSEAVLVPKSSRTKDDDEDEDEY